MANRHKKVDYFFIKLLTAFIVITILTYNFNPFFDMPHKERIGAICQDGCHSSATGSGACSHHGGVSKWLYKETPHETGVLTKIIVSITIGAVVTMLILGLIGLIKDRINNDS